MNTMRIKNILAASAYIMQMVAYIMALPFIGYWQYRKNSGINQWFCFHMCSHYMFRQVYLLTFATGIATVNLLNMLWTGNPQSSSLTLAVSVLLLFDRVSHPLLMELNRSQHLHYGVMIIALAALFTSHMTPFAISLYLLLVAANFYPSRRAMENFQSYRGIQFYRKYPVLLLEAYFN